MNERSRPFGPLVHGFAKLITGRMPSELTAVALLAAVAADRAADIFRELQEPLRSTLLNGQSQETKNTISALLAYPERSAGSIMTTEFVSVNE